MSEIFPEWLSWVLCVVFLYILFVYIKDQRNKNKKKEDKNKSVPINWTMENLPDTKCLQCGWVGHPSQLEKGRWDYFSVCPNCKEENTTTLSKNEQIILKYLCQPDWYE